MSDGPDSRPELVLRPSALDDLGRQHMTKRKLAAVAGRFLLPVTYGTATYLCFRQISGATEYKEVGKYLDLVFVGFDPLYKQLAAGGASFLIGLTIDAVIRSALTKQRAMTKRAHDYDEGFPTQDMHPGPWEVREMSARPRAGWKMMALKI